ncbi:unnamed protein product [Prorocentrum cordatum]|uniref:Uncharacterized protein n=1 Tax=Prorocentrum cordatum TaxID=2364126 RepID=A0ABN9RVV6_9DINO|nr:unnamed protein product [Polarella glacialis]
MSREGKLAAALAFHLEHLAQLLHRQAGAGDCRALEASLLAAGALLSQGPGDAQTAEREAETGEPGRSSSGRAAEDVAGGASDGRLHDDRCGGHDEPGEPQGPPAPAATRQPSAASGRRVQKASLLSRSSEASGDRTSSQAGVQAAQRPRAEGAGEGPPGASGAAPQGRRRRPCGGRNRR